MALRKINVGKNFKNPSMNSIKIQPYMTERMFKNIEELQKRASELRKTKSDVIVNEKLLTTQYR